MKEGLASLLRNTIVQSEIHPPKLILTKYKMKFQGVKCGF